jgi:hypothetical protein
MKHLCAFQFIPGRGIGIQQLVRPFILTQFTTCLRFRPTDKTAIKTLPIIRIQHLRLHTSTMGSAQISRLHHIRQRASTMTSARVSRFRM